MSSWLEDKFDGLDEEDKDGYLKCAYDFSQHILDEMSVVMTARSSVGASDMFSYDDVASIIERMCIGASSLRSDENPEEAKKEPNRPMTNAEIARWLWNGQVRGEYREVMSESCRYSGTTTSWIDTRWDYGPEDANDVPDDDDCVRLRINYGKWMKPNIYPGKDE